MCTAHMLRGVVLPAQVEDARRKISKFQGTNDSRYTYHQRHGNSFDGEETWSWLLGNDNGKTQCLMCNILDTNHFVRATRNDKFARGEQIGIILTHHVLVRHTWWKLHIKSIQWVHLLEPRHIITLYWRYTLGYQKVMQSERDAFEDTRVINMSSDTSQSPPHASHSSNAEQYTCISPAIKSRKTPQMVLDVDLLKLFTCNVRITVYCLLCGKPR